MNHQQPEHITNAVAISVNSLAGSSALLSTGRREVQQQLHPAARARLEDWKDWAMFCSISIKNGNEDRSTTFEVLTATASVHKTRRSFKASHSYQRQHDPRKQRNATTMLTPLGVLVIVRNMTKPPAPFEGAELKLAGTRLVAFRPFERRRRRAGIRCHKHLTPPG